MSKPDSTKINRGIIEDFKKKKVNLSLSGEGIDRKQIRPTISFSPVNSGPKRDAFALHRAPPILGLKNTAFPSQEIRTLPYLPGLKIDIELKLREPEKGIKNDLH